jgi:alpha/beta superfamily hydrolase
VAFGGGPGGDFSVTAAEMNVAEEARALAVLLHPHPHFGGNRLHPFIDGLFHRLPGVAVTAIRFDFTSAEPAAAREEVMAALDEASLQWPELPVVLAGYSFGAGIAAELADLRIAAWYLLAPPAAMLSAAAVGGDRRPKAIVVPEFDQFSPPDAIAHTVAGWETTTVTTLPKADHFLGSVQRIVDDALRWIEAVSRSGSVSGPEA